MSGGANPGGWMDEWNLGPYQVLAIATVGVFLIAGSVVCLLGDVGGGDGVLSALVRLYPDWPSCAHSSTLGGDLLLASPIIDTIGGVLLLVSSVRYWRNMISDE